MADILLRRYRSADLGEMMQIFYDTIHSVCVNEYTPAQLDAWAPAQRNDQEKWNQRFESMYTLVAEENGRLLAYAGLMASGEIDMVYTHKDAQGRGIASLIFAALEEEARRQQLCRIVIDGSLTATPFYQKRGYRIYTTRFKINRGQAFTNYLLEKYLC